MRLQGLDKESERDEDFTRHLHRQRNGEEFSHSITRGIKIAYRSFFLLQTTKL